MIASSPCRAVEGGQDRRGHKFESIDLSGDTIKIILINNTTPVNVHRNLLMKSSPYFRQLFQQHPDHIDSVKLSDTEYDNFLKYVQFLYKGQIPCHERPAKDTDDYWYDHKRQQSRTLVELRLLGCLLKDVAFQNATIDALFHNFGELDWEGDRWCLDTDVINKAYEGTEKGSALRRLVVDISKWCETPAGLAATKDLLHRDFLADLAVVLLLEHDQRYPSSSIPRGVSTCDYHLHGEDGEASRGRSAETEYTETTEMEGVETDNSE